MANIVLCTNGSVPRQKGKSLLAFPNDYVAIDLETTGLDPAFDAIIELAAIRVSDGKVCEQFQSLVNPGYEIDDFIKELTGITDEMLLSAPALEDAFPSFLEFVGDSLIVGHNVNFDINFVYDHAMRLYQKPFSNDFIDTMRLSRRLFPEEHHHRLCDLIGRFEIEHTAEHRASADAAQTIACLHWMQQYAASHQITPESLYPHRNLSAADIHATTTEFDETSPVYGKLFVFTGTLEKMTRRDAMQVVVDHGGQCGNGVTKNTNFLVLGNLDYSNNIKGGKSAKLKKAEQLKLSGADIEILSENTFYDMIGD